MIHSPYFPGYPVPANISIGALSFLGLMTLGQFLCRRIEFNLPHPWRFPVAFVLGLQSYALLVFALAIVSVAYPGVLAGMALALVLAGLVPLVQVIRRPPTGKIDRTAVFFGVICLAPLIIAALPALKYDDLYYHNALPQRIAAEHALHFLRLPFESAIMPQMVYQISLTPLHALGLPHAGNIESGAIWVCAMVFCFRLILKQTASRQLATFGTLGLFAGMYPVVWYTSSAGHAFGDLAMILAVLALVFRDELIDHSGEAGFAFLLSLAAISAAGTKVTMLPAAALMIGGGAVYLCRRPGARRMPIVAGALAPVVFFYLPYCLWTWRESGSPWGPLLAGRFGHTVYDLDRIHLVLRQTSEINRAEILPIFKFGILGFSAPLWALDIGGIGFCLFSRSRRPRLLLPVALFTLQLVLIAAVTPFDFRYLGGTQYALAIAMLCWAGYPLGLNILNPQRAERFVWCLLPWLALQVIYVRPFVPYFLHLKPLTQLYQDYVPFFQDFQVLDRMLPGSAVLLSPAQRFDSIYAPRPIFYDPADLPKTSPRFFIVAGDFPVNETAYDLGPEFTLGAVIYENPHALILASRVPSNPPTYGKLLVFQLLSHGDPK